MSKETFIKYMTVAVLSLATILIPWWAVLVFLVIPFFMFESFLGGLIVALIMDIVYGPLQGFGFPFPFFVAVLLGALLLPFLKRRLVFGK